MAGFSSYHWGNRLTDPRGSPADASLLVRNRGEWVARGVPEDVGGRPLGSEVPLEVPFVGYPDVAPERSVITAQLGVPSQPSVRCCGEIKVHPHPNVEKVKDLWMEQPDEIHHEDRAFGVRHRRAEPSLCPVIWLMLAGLPSPKRFQDLTGEPDTIDATPIRGSTVRPGRIQEVITSDSHATRDTLGEPRGKRALPTPTEPGMPTTAGDPRLLMALARSSG